MTYTSEKVRSWAENATLQTTVKEMLTAFADLLAQIERAQITGDPRKGVTAPHKLDCVATESCKIGLETVQPNVGGNPRERSAAK